MNGATGDALPTLRDADQMRAIFQTWVQPAQGATMVVESCSVDFVREASARSLLQYTLHLLDRGSGARYTQQVSGVVYPRERGDAEWRRLRTSADPSPTSAFGLPSWTYVPDLQTLFQVYPFDHRLPALAELAAGVPPALLPSVLAACGDGATELVAWQSEVVRYRVDMRAMVRLEVQARDRHAARLMPRRLYAKVYRAPGEGEEAYSLQRELWTHSVRDEMGFRVARPLSYVRSLRTLLFDEVPGRRLLDILRRGGEVFPAVRQTARAIAALHQLPLDVLPGVRERAARDDADRLAPLVERLQTALPAASTQIQDVVAAIAAGLPNAPEAPTHFDLKPGHLLIGDAHVGVLDFDKLAAGDPLADVTGLVASFGKVGGEAQRRSNPESALAQAFLAEYFARVPASWVARFPACYALALLTEAATTGRGLRGRAEKANRAARMAALVQQAHTAVGRHPW